MQGWLGSSTNTSTNQNILPYSILMITASLPAQPVSVHHDAPYIFIHRHLQKLESLEICGGRVTDLGVAVLSTVPSLTSLSLAHNLAITDTALPLLARLTNLCSLNLTHSKISGNGLTALYGLTVSRSAASWESECMQDVTTVSCLPAGLLVVFIHTGCATADQSSFTRLLASSALVCVPPGVQQA